MNTHPNLSFYLSAAAIAISLANMLFVWIINDSPRLRTRWIAATILTLVYALLIFGLLQLPPE